MRARALGQLRFAMLAANAGNLRPLRLLAMRLGGTPQANVAGLSDLIGPERSEGPSLSTLQTPSLHGLEAAVVVHAHDTPCKSPLSVSASGLLAAEPGEGDWPRSGRMETASDGMPVAAGSPAARLRDPQRGDDGRVLR